MGLELVAIRSVFKRLSLLKIVVLFYLFLLFLFGYPFYLLFCFYRFFKYSAKLKGLPVEEDGPIFFKGSVLFRDDLEKKTKEWKQRSVQSAKTWVVLGLSTYIFVLLTVIVVFPTIVCSVANEGPLVGCVWGVSKDFSINPVVWLSVLGDLIGEIS